MAWGKKGVIDRNYCLFGISGPFSFRKTSYHYVPPTLTHSLNNKCQRRPHRLAYHQILSQESSPSGTDLVFWLTVDSSNPHLLSRSTERDSWLRKRRTVVIGFLHCPSLNAACALRTRQCEYLSVCGSGSAYAFHTTATVEP